jgi:hypothetical protein
MRDHYRSIPRSALLAALLAMAGAAAQAARVPVFNTGVDASGNPLAAGAPDPHWQFVAGPGVDAPTPAVVLTEQHPHGDYFADPGSRWIWADASGAAATGRAYTFEQQVDLTGFRPGSVTLVGSWGADNFGSILINGKPPRHGSGTFALFDSVGDNYNQSHDFVIGGGFVAGLNRVQFQVEDTGVPGGLNVFGLHLNAAPIPEPDGRLTLAAGLLLLSGVLQWRKRRE